jgi:hypothetical protein
MIELDNARAWPYERSRFPVVADIRDAVSYNDDCGRPASRRVDRVNRAIHENKVARLCRRADRRVEREQSP